MEYWNVWKVENDSVRERYELSAERIGMIAAEETVAEPYRSYFQSVAAFIREAARVFLLAENGELRELEIDELQELNHRLYSDILPGNYETSYANPAYAAERLGAEYGPMLAYLYAEIRGQIAFVHECRLTEITILNELFIEIYNMFEEEVPAAERIREVLFWFASDYTDLTAQYRVRELLDPSLTFALDIIRESDLNDLRYLYFYGEYVSPEELEIAEFLNGLPQETINCMADTYTEGYRKGFEVTGCDLSKKRNVTVLYELGFERVVKKAVSNFAELGLQSVLYRCGVWSMDKSPNGKRGYHGASANKQYDYDHRYDHAIYLQKAYTDRRLAVLGTTYEKYKALAADYAGPAVIETFGEAGFHPVNKKEALSLSEKQEKLMLSVANASAQLGNQYIPGEETSFTIIAFPRPSIGPRFAEIFAETIKVNTLDYERYKKIQQHIIDRLDLAEYVVVTGKDKNHTNLKVMLHTLSDPTHQSNFENCVADVNIPLGEVFTSPVLSGTEGVLEVSSVYIGNVQFKNLHMEFKDGKVTSYTCDNFQEKEHCRALVKQMIMKNHDTLPVGEFAIGTNTVAYAMAQTYDIVDRLPILIVEKMGPHFAVGDTCYSWAEDKAVYNPDGKELIARDNEISLLRKEDLSKAYFNCHTDITIPYRELGEIYGVTAAGEKLPIIADGRFVVPGTEELNEALDESQVSL